MKKRFLLLAASIIMLLCVCACNRNQTEMFRDPQAVQPTAAVQSAAPATSGVETTEEQIPAVEQTPTVQDESEADPAAPAETQPDENETRGKTVAEMLAEKNAVPHDLENNGIWYGKKKNVSAYLFMGIDMDGEVPEAHTSYVGGQSDVLMLVVVDDDAKTYSLIQINRDTMTDVELIDYYGVPTGVKVRQQICLSHSYGDGTEPSCENVVRTVSSLFGGIEIDGYCSVTYDAVPLMNDALGGICVTIEDDFSKMDPSLVMGETIELTGEQAIHFVRGRQSVGDGTNLARERRQRTYLNAFREQLKETIQVNSAVIDDIYHAAEPYMVADLSLGELSTLAVKCMDYSGGGIISPTGSWQEVEYANGNTYVEYVLDEDALQQLVLELFYQPAE